MSPGFNAEFVWPDTGAEAIDESFCFHARKFLESYSKVDTISLEKLNVVIPALERRYASTKVIWGGWPKDFAKFIRDSIDWNSSPGWPWKSSYPTNRDLFAFDGVKMDPGRVKMVETAVKARWDELIEGVSADPLFSFIKPEPHKISKAEKKAWRLISGVGLTDTLVDRILYGEWLDNTIMKWPEIPSKAGWAPQQGGFRWLARVFRGKEPVSIDKSAWDWTVNEWHVDVLERLIPRMMFRTSDEWKKVFTNRMKALFHASYPVFKMNCGCEYVQLITGIIKSGSLGTIAFNSLLQFATHLAAGGSEEDLLVSVGDDTSQDGDTVTQNYLDKLRKTGALIKEIDRGWPIKFAGHLITEGMCEPAYLAKHAFNLSYLDEKFAAETLDSYRHLYALENVMGAFLENQVIDMFGPENVVSREYLREWYEAYD